MSSYLYLDIETYSREDIRKVDVYRYVEAPDFEILMCSWARGDDPVQVAYGMADVAAIPGLWDNRVLKVAHNAQFERICFSRMQYLMDTDSPWPAYLDPRYWVDTMALAATHGYPRSLAGAAEAMGLPVGKDTEGKALIRLFCRPQPKTGKRVFLEDEPEKAARFGEYNRQDTVVCRAIQERLGGFPTEAEHEVWIADQRVNDRGIALDRTLVRDAMQAGAANAKRDEEELAQLTGCNPRSPKQLVAWFQEQGLRSMKDLTKETVARKLASPAVQGSTPTANRVRRALELRQDLALVAYKKFAVADSCCCTDGRLRGQFNYYGAHTGRWSSVGVQLQNLASLQFEEPWQTEAAVMDLRMGNGADSETLKKLVRAMFIGPLITCDYTSIEAIVIAWLAGEKWVMDAYNARRDLYTETADRMSTSERKYVRKEGKVAVLALGYQGAVNSLRAFGAVGDDSELQAQVDFWRRANRNIVAMWATLQRAFLAGGPVGEHLMVEIHGRDRWIILPSGRPIIYHDVKAVESFWNKETKKRYSGIGFASPKIAGARASTYGGRLTENVTQAVARDILAHALVRLEKEGFRPMGHIHDEILVDAPPSATETVQEIMTTQPHWAASMPLRAVATPLTRYRKA